MLRCIIICKWFFSDREVVSAVFLKKKSNTVVSFLIAISRCFDKIIKHVHSEVLSSLKFFYESMNKMGEFKRVRSVLTDNYGILKIVL